jgi:hypothetical protein
MVRESKDWDNRIEGLDASVTDYLQDLSDQERFERHIDNVNALAPSQTSTGVSVGREYSWLQIGKWQSRRMDREETRIHGLLLKPSGDAESNYIRVGAASVPASMFSLIEDGDFEIVNII